MKNPRPPHKNLQKSTKESQVKAKSLLYYFVLIKLQTIANMKFCIHISKEVNYVIKS